MYLEFKRKELEDADAMRDAQRNMTWFALGGLLLYPFAVVVASLVGLDEAQKTLGSMAPTYFVAVAGIVAAFLGISLSNYTKNFVSDYLYVGSYLTLAILTLVPAFLLFFFRDIREVSFVSNEENKSRN